MLSSIVSCRFTIVDTEEVFVKNKSSSQNRISIFLLSPKHLVHQLSYHFSIQYESLPNIFREYHSTRTSLFVISLETTRRRSCNYNYTYLIVSYMGSACSTGTKDDALVQETTAVVPIVSPHTPESVNKITPINVPSKIALMRLFNDYDLDGYVLFFLFVCNILLYFVCLCVCVFVCLCVCVFVKSL